MQVWLYIASIDMTEHAEISILFAKKRLPC